MEDRLDYSIDSDIQRYFEMAVKETGADKVLKALCRYIFERYDNNLWEFITDYCEDYEVDIW